MAFPNLLIAGATKAGTTSVFRYLADHPAVCASLQKEINFFFRFADSLDEQRLQQYQGYFRHCSGKESIRLEASPVYLSGGNWAAQKINQYMPDTKLIFILRDPVARYVSHFKFWLAKTDNVADGIGVAEAIAEGLSGDIVLGQRSKDLDWPSRARQLVRAGCYARALSGYLAEIPPERICVTFFEDLVRDPGPFMRRICHFAQIDPTHFDDYAFAVENKTRIVRFKGLHKLTIGTNNLLQPLLNRAPVVRKGIRSVYYAINRETARGEERIEAPDLAALIDFYRTENDHLRTLLGATYPDLALADWLRNSPAP